MNIVVSEKANKILVPPLAQLHAVFGKQAPTVAWKGQKYLVFPHTPQYVLALRKLGVTAPGPMRHNYDWPGPQTAFEAQKDTADMLSLNARAYVLSDIGVGKTRSALFAADYLMHQGLVRKCLVIAPLSTLNTVWEAEIFSVMPHRTSISLHHPAKKGRLRRLQEDVDFYILNHNGSKVLRDELIARDDFDCVIIDELTVLRTATTQIWGATRDVIAGRKYVWGMTGSPIPNGPEDAYGQVKLLTPERVPKSFRAWKAITMLKVAQFIWVPKKDALDKVYDAMRPAVRYTRDECLDLPERMTTTLSVEMAPRQKSIYEELTKRYKARLIEGDVKAVNEGVLVNKLLQVSCGFVYTDTKGEVDLKNQSRLDVLKSIIQAAQNKVIVFAPFIFTVGMLAREVSAYAEIGVVHGQVSKPARDDIFRRFQSGTKMKVLIAHPGCMAHGLTLTKSNVIVWYSPIQRPDIYEQANGRITRSGQTNKQFIVHLCGTKVETKVYTRLQRKQAMQGVLLDMYRGTEADD